MKNRASSDDAGNDVGFLPLRWLVVFDDHTVSEMFRRRP
jgi:hypothetical protein